MDFRTMNSFLMRFSRDENATIATIIALMLFAILGFAAAAIDMSYANSTRTELQVTASAAALAGVQQIVDDNEDGIDDTHQYRRGAVEYVYRNMAASKHGNVVQAACGTYDPASKTVSGDSECSDVKVGYWAPATRTFTPWDDPAWDPVTMALDAVRVRAHRSRDNANPLGLFLAPAVGLAEQDINVSAIAWAQGLSHEYCMIALDPSAPQSVHVEGEANITSDGCGICVNSNDPGGLWLNGQPIINVDTGEVTVNASDYHTEGAADIFPTPTLNGGACSDPYAGTNPFDTYFDDTTCAEGTSPTLYDGGAFSLGDVHVSPGLHCGGLTFKSEGHVVFEPGIHHIKNGTLLEEGNHTYFAGGVTFLIDNATVNFGGSQSNDLSAGADGSPFLFYENPDGPHPTEDHIFRGDADADYEGIIYTPDRNVEFVGETLGGDTPPDCFAVIANKFHFTGTTDIMLNSDGCGGELEISSVTVRLVD